MMEGFTANATHIFLACGPTDFRKQAESLSNLVSLQFKSDPYDGNFVFVFCNKKRNAIKVLRYDHNGFILASKKFLDGMKFSVCDKLEGEKMALEIKNVSKQFEDSEIPTLKNINLHI